jgi:hypothetical protein
MMDAETEVYKTDRGTVWRIIRADDGGMRVELLKEDEWVPGPIGMAGLRLSSSTTRLTDAAVRKLPS